MESLDEREMDIYNKHMQALREQTQSLCVHQGTVEERLRHIENVLYDLSMRSNEHCAAIGDSGSVSDALPGNDVKELGRLKATQGG